MVYIYIHIYIHLLFDTDFLSTGFVQGTTLEGKTEINCIFFLVRDRAPWIGESIRIGSGFEWQETNNSSGVGWREVSFLSGESPGNDSYLILRIQALPHCFFLKNAAPTSCPKIASAIRSTRKLAGEDKGTEPHSKLTLLWRALSAASDERGGITAPDRGPYSQLKIMCSFCNCKGTSSAVSAGDAEKGVQTAIVWGQSKWQKASS